MRRKGLSLLETIFCCALLGIFLSVVSQLVVQAYRTQALYRDRLERQRGATVFLQKMVRALQSATQVHQFSTGAAPAGPVNLSSDSVLVTFQTSGGLRTNQYFRDNDARTVNVEQFGQTFLFTDSSTWVNLPSYPRVELRQTEGLTFEPFTVGTLKFWRIKLTLEGLPQPYVREVRRQPTEGL